MNKDDFTGDNVCVSLPTKGFDSYWLYVSCYFSVIKYLLGNKMCFNQIKTIYRLISSHVHTPVFHLEQGLYYLICKFDMQI